MKDSILERMKQESAKKDPMIPRTVRLQTDLDTEMHEFASSHDLDFSVLVRTVMLLGWKVFTDE